VWTCLAGSSGRHNVNAIASIKFDFPKFMIERDIIFVRLLKVLTTSVRSNHCSKVTKRTDLVQSFKRFKIFKFDRVQLSKNKQSSIFGFMQMFTYKTEATIFELRVGLSNLNYN
jgi:hypothetical protein